MKLLDRIEPFEPYVRWTLLVIGFFAALFLGGCAATMNPLVSQDGTSTAYRNSQVPQQVNLATVIAVRDVRVNNNSAQTAGYAGGAVSGLIGHAVARKLSKDTTKQLLIAGLLGFAGGAVSNQAASTVTGQEIVVKIDGQKQVVAIAQSSADGLRFRRGDRVMVIGMGRVAHLNL